MGPVMERPTDRSRLPRSVALPSRGAQVARGLLALVATAAAVVGVPVLLYTAFGSPWPDTPPSLEWLTEPTSTEALIGVLAAVVWLGWAHFVVCLAVEAVAERRRRGLAPSVPGGRVGTQALARRAVATIALLASTAAASAGTVSAASASGPSGAEAPPTSVAATSSVTAGQAGAQAGASTPVADRAAGQQQSGSRSGMLPDGPELVDAKAANPGVATYYEVRPPEGRNYDTLWDIAERYLDSGIRYKEIWELNRGRLQGDGRMLQDADLIHPGWVVRLPNDARGPGLKVVNHAAEAAPGDKSDEAPDAAPGGGVKADAVTTADDQASGSGGSTAFQDDLISDSWSPLFGVAGGLAMAGAFLELRRRRSSLKTRQLWAGALGTRGPNPDPDGPNGPGDGPGTSQRLREEADTTTATWLDRALRSSWRPATPAPARAWVADSGLAVAFDEPPGSPPAPPWTARGDRVWALPADAATLPGAVGAAPLPGLVCAGRRDDGTLLMIDPESVPGVVALDGDPDIARGVAMSTALDTATHEWADRRTVTLVGFAEDLTMAGKCNIRRTADLGRIIESLENVARYHRSACRAAGVSSAREARIAAPDAIDWTYHLVVCSGVPSADELRALHELAADPAVSLGVVVIGAVSQAGLGLTARADGRLAAPMHGIDVTAQVLTVAAARGFTALYQLGESEHEVTLDQVVDRIEAEHPVPSTRARARLGIFGPVTLTASGDVEAERRDFLTELACFLALHPGGVHVNRISAALWPRGVEPEVRDRALRQLAAWLGETEEGEPVLAEASGVWSLTPGAVSVDWDTFREFLNAAGHQPEHAEHHLRAALDLVRGRPFQDVPDGRYGWLESTSTESDVSLAVVLTALTAAEKAAGRGDAEAARSALADGIAVVPASEELWCSRLRLEADLGDAQSLRDTADAMYQTIAAHGSPIGAGPQTDALVDELLPGYRSRAA